MQRGLLVISLLLIGLASAQWPTANVRTVGMWQCLDEGQPVAFVIPTVQQDQHTFLEVTTVDLVAQRLVAGGYVRFDSLSDKTKAIISYLSDPNCVVPDAKNRPRQVVCTIFTSIAVELSKVKGIVLAAQFPGQPQLTYLPCKQMEDSFEH